MLPGLRTHPAHRRTQAWHSHPAEPGKSNERATQLGPRSAFNYAYQVLNAQPDGQNHPDLQVQTRLFRDGKEVYQGKPAALPVEGQPDPRRLIGAGSMRLGDKITPGDYVLQVIVTDKLAKEKSRIATQAMDFEIAPGQ